MEAASKYAYNIGVAFKIKEDLLDVLGDEKKLGKPVGSDEEHGKTTYVTMVGTEKAQKDVELLTKNAIDYLSKFRYSEFLIDLSEKLVTREK